MDKLLTIREVAEVTHIPVKTLYNYRSEGKGPTSARVAGRILYRLRDVEQWLDEQFGQPERAAQ